MHPSIQMLAYHGTNLSHQVNQTKTVVQTRTKVNKHEQHPSGTQNKKKDLFQYDFLFYRTCLIEQRLAFMLF